MSLRASAGKISNFTLALENDLDKQKDYAYNQGTIMINSV